MACRRVERGASAVKTPVSLHGWNREPLRHRKALPCLAALILAICILGLTPPCSALGSHNVVIIGGQTISVDGYDDSCANVMGCSDGGWLPITGPLGELGDFVFFAMSTANVSAANLSAFDTAVLNLGSTGMACSADTLTAQQKADLVAFVASGNKLIICDSECAAVDYSWLPYPFTTSNPGGMGQRKTLSVVDNGILASYDATDPLYIDATALSDNTDTASDMNVMASYDSHWQVSVSGTNYLDVTGPSLAYAKYPTPTSDGIFIYNGLSQDYQYYEPMWLRKVWVQTLEQGNAAYALPPAPVTSFTATAGNRQVALSWANPSDADFSATMIRFRTDSYPTSAFDGSLLADRLAAPGSSDSIIHTGLTNGVTYYYSAFTHDIAPHYSSAANASGTTAGSVDDWIDESFDGYPNGNLAGLRWMTIAPTAAQVESGFVKGGNGKSCLMDTVASGQSIASEIDCTDKTTGSYLVSFDIAENATGTAGQELATVCLYGSDSATEICKVHVQAGKLFLEYGTGSLAVISATVTNSTWYNVRLTVNVDTRKVDVSLDGASKGTNFSWKTGPSKLSRIVFTSDRNAAVSPQKVYFDNLRLEPKPGQVASVTNDGTWSPSQSKLHFTFPAVAGTYEYRYCIGTASGGAQTRGWTSCGTATDVTATGLSLAESTTTYYVTVVCANQFGTIGSNRTASGIKIAPSAGTINAAKALANGNSSTIKSLRGKMVSAIFPGYFYVQEPGMPLSAMKVVSNASVSPGDMIDAAGQMGGYGAERYLDCTSNGVIRSPGSGAPHAVGMAGTFVGGKDLVTGAAPGVVGGKGLHDMGLYVTVLGKVTQRQTTSPQYFYLDDGSGLGDGTTTSGVGNVGLRIVSDPSAYASGSYVVVRGVISCFNSNGLRPQILPVSIQTVRQAN